MAVNVTTIGLSNWLVVFTHTSTVESLSLVTYVGLAIMNDASVRSGKEQCCVVDTLMCFNEVLTVIINDGNSYQSRVYNYTHLCRTERHREVFIILQNVVIDRHYSIAVLQSLRIQSEGSCPTIIITWSCGNSCITEQSVRKMTTGLHVASPSCVLTVRVIDLSSAP